MDMNGFRPATAGPIYILSSCGWVRVVAVGSGRLEMVLVGWLWVVVDDFGWFQVVSGVFGWFAALVATSV